MQDQSLYSKSQPQSISEGLQNFIDSMVEEIVLGGRAFDTQKKWLRKYAENEGINYEELEKNLNEFFETMEELRLHESKSSERLAKMLGEDCYLTEKAVDKLVAAAEGARNVREEAERKAKEEAERKAREEAARKAKEEAERKAREEAERKAKEEAERKVSEEVEKEASFEEGVLHYYIINYHDNGKNEVEVSYSGDKQLCPKEIIIPPTVVHNGLTYTVSVISTYGFSELSNLGSITIPNTIEKIYDFAFYKCRSLRTIKMGESIKSIGDSAFHTCTSIEYLQLPPKIESIAPNTFSQCENIKTISIPDTVESIGAYAFNGTGLRELTIPKSVRFIEEYAFAYCKKLKHHKVENPNCKIEPHAFDNWNFFERLFV